MTRQTIAEVEAVERTLKDCSRCDVVSRCDAHVTGGSWHHQRGCRPIIDADEYPRALALVEQVQGRS